MSESILNRPAETVAATVPSSPSARWALAVLSLSMLLSALGTSIANVGLPAMAVAFAASFEQVQWIVLAYLLAVTTLVVGAGRLGDLFGRRRLLLAGLAVFTASSVVCGAAPGLALLIAARAVQGLGAAVMTALTLSFVGETVGRERMGSAMGLLGTMSAVGTALGPSLGGVLVAGFGWRALFLVNVPLGILTLVLAYRHLPTDRRARTVGRADLDLPGTLLLALTLAAYALVTTADRGGAAPFALAAAVVAIIGLGLFIRTESAAALPLLPPALFRDRARSAGLAMSALVSAVVMATLVIGPFYLARGLGLDAASVGAVMSIGPLVAALAGVPAGRLVDRSGARRTVVVGLAGVAAGCLLLSAVPMRFGIPGYVAPLVVITAGYALFQAANNTAVMADILPEQRGVVSGMLNLSRQIGLITGASAMGAVFARASGAFGLTAAAPEAVAAGMRTTFAVAAIATIPALAIAVAFAAPSRGPKPPAQIL